MNLCNYSKMSDSNSAISQYTEVLISKAVKESGELISLPTHVQCIEECITRFDNRLLFWYNDSTGNTKIVDLELD